MSEEMKMSALKPCACAKCGNSPDVVDHRIRFIVICDCQVPANLAYGNSVGFLDHIEDDSVASIAFDAVNMQELMHSAISEWNTTQQLIEIYNQNSNLTEENKRLREFCESLQLDVSNEIKLEQLLSELGGD